MNSPEEIDALRAVREWCLMMDDRDEMLSQWLNDARIEPPTIFRRDLDRLFEAIRRK